MDNSNALTDGIWRPCSQLGRQSSPGPDEHRWEPSGTGAFRAYKRKALEDDDWNREAKRRCIDPIIASISPPTYIIGSELLDDYLPTYIPGSELMETLLMPVYSPRINWSPVLLYSPLIMHGLFGWERVFSAPVVYQLQETFFWESSRSDVSGSPLLQDWHFYEDEPQDEIDEKVARVDELYAIEEPLDQNDVEVACINGCAEEYIKQEPISVEYHLEEQQTVYYGW